MRCLEPTNTTTHQTLSLVRPQSARARMDALATRAQQGDARAADQLAQLLYTSLRPVVGRMTRGLPQADLEDVLQDVVIAAFEKDLARFDPTRGAFLSFVAKRLGWRIADVVRQHRRAPGPSLDDVMLDIVDPTQTPEAQTAAHAHEQALLALPRMIDATLATLRDQQARHAFVAHDLRGRTIVDVAGDLGIHASNACRARQRALAHLARTLPPSIRLAA
jgi:RNA polymerase sigma factor (sigma-70 family)